MTVPTRFIEKDEFNRILNEEEGDVIILHKVIPLYWHYENDGTLGMRSVPPMYVIFVNVAEPVIYKDEEARRVIILANMYLDYDYELVRDLHVRRDADAYCVTLNEWQADDLDWPLELATYFFRDEDVKYGKVDTENVLPAEERGKVH